MKTQSQRRNAVLALGALALLGVSFAASPVQAQDAGAAGAAGSGKPISLNLINVSVQAALRTLFSSAGIRNYTIDPGVQGYANINVSDVPFTLALRQLLSSVNPLMTYSVDNGIYNVKVQAAAVAPPVTVSASSNGDSGSLTTDNQQKRFYSIPIDSYDAYYIATLVGQQGIIQVEPNYPSQSSQDGTQGGQNGNNNNRNNNRRGNGGFGGGLSTPVTSVGGTSGFGGGGFGGGGYRGY